MPAYNASATLERTYRDIPADAAHEVILVDDGSHDDTVDIAARLGVHVIEHAENRGYGGNQKTCYTEALARGADIVIMLHPDFQYDSRLIPFYTGFLRMGVCDVMLGSRIRTRREALAGGMPVLKYFVNRALTLLMNIALGQNLADCHSGFRVYSRKVLETINYEDNADDFSFDAEVIAQVAAAGFRTGEAPMPVRYFPDASSIGLRDGVVYSFKILNVLLKFLLFRLKLYHGRLFRTSE